MSSKRIKRQVRDSSKLNIGSVEIEAANERRRKWQNAKDKVIKGINKRDANQALRPKRKN
jgi:hypothetical protein